MEAPSKPIELKSGEVFIPINPKDVVLGETTFEVANQEGIITEVVIDKDGNLNLPLLPPGVYTIKNTTTAEVITFMIEDEQVPLAGINFNIEETPSEMGNTPQTGVSQTIDVLLFAIMSLSLLGILITWFRRKQQR